MDLNIRIPTIVPIKGRGFINHGSWLGLLDGDSGVQGLRFERFRAWGLGCRVRGFRFKALEGSGFHRLGFDE